MSDLAPCPFCGGKHIGVTHRFAFHERRQLYEGVVLCACEASLVGEIKPTPEEAEITVKRKWNARNQRTETM